MCAPILRIRAAETVNELARFVLTYRSQGKLAEASAEVPPLLFPADQESIRWYLEEYRKFPFEPASTIAKGVATQLQEVGEKLFERLFDSAPEARELWNAMEQRIAETRIEVESDASRFSVPWEILWNPLDVMPLSCRAASFVRTTAAAQRGRTSPSADIIRVLLVISRPAGGLDVPFRSVAARILERVGGDSRFRFEVLRPPTFAALCRKLTEASEQGRPYTVLHFDGHGVHEDRMATLENRPAKKRRGYLLFEHPSVADEAEYVNGLTMAQVLSNGRVPVLILNACRSARAEIWDEHLGDRRPLGSLADEILQSGQPGVLAMQYNVDVKTASRFVADLYQALADERSLAEAVREGRRALFEDTRPRRPGESRGVQDWVVPVLFEASPLSPLLRAKVTNVREARPAPEPHASYPCGIVGGDDTLMAIERAFQRVPVVVLTGQVGSGKSRLAAEFIAWIARTTEAGSEASIVAMGGGRRLDPLVTAYRRTHPALELGEDPSASMCSWLAEQPGLLVLDDVGSGTASETAELERLLSMVSAGGRRTLVVTRAPELSLGLPIDTVAVGPLDLSERVLLARTVLPAGTELDSDGWREILMFSQGNPAALIQLTRQFFGGSTDPQASLKRARTEPLGLGQEFSAVLRTSFVEEELECLAVAALLEGAVSARTLPMLRAAGSQLCPSLDTVPPLFERLSEHGLATPIGSDYYQMHPGLPGLLHPEFERRYPGTRGETLRGTVVTFFSTLCAVFYGHGESGERHSYDVAMQTLRVIEPTIWRALDEAKERNRWTDVRNLLSGLRRLLVAQGRYPEWRRLADNMWALVANSSTENPLPKRESVWYVLQEDRIELLMKSHSLGEAAWLQERVVASARADLAQLESSESVTHARQALIQQLARLGDIRKEQGQVIGADYYREALGIAQRFGLERDEYRIACRLALFYLSGEFRKLEAVPYWLGYASDVCPPFDRIGQARLKAIAGQFALAHVQAERRSPAEREHFLKTAADSFSAALELFSGEPSDERAASEVHLGQVLFEQWRSLPEAMQRLQSAIACYDADQNVYKASFARLEASRILSRAGEQRRAYWYAIEAGRGFARLAPHAETEVIEAQKFAGTVDTRG